MAKLTVGELMPDFTYETPFAKDLTLSETVGRAKKTALLFLRYYGCTLCQYDIHQLQARHADLTARGGQVLVVLQSDPRRLAEELKTPEALPFPLICDPDSQLCHRRSSLSQALKTCLSRRSKASCTREKGTARLKRRWQGPWKAVLHRARRQ